MGKKSDKKFKSDRVNALRKQYDAFLDEDKKRKERNEYILGRLDNMRYNATAVQIRHKLGYGDVVPTYNRVSSERRDIQIAHHQISRTNHENLQLDVPRKYLDDATLLREISKKYILIPKLRPSLMNDYVSTVPPQSHPSVSVSPPQINITSNDDWKSKYDILEQLKKDEKEEQTNKFDKDELFPVKESITLSKDDSSKLIDGSESNLGFVGYDSQKATDGYDLQNYNTKICNKKYEHEVPEKDLTFDKIKVGSETPNLAKSNISDNKPQEPITDHAPVSGDATHIIPEINTLDDHTLQSQDLEYNSLIVESTLNANNIEENVQYNDYSEENFPSEYNCEDVTRAYNSSEHQINGDAQQGEENVQYNDFSENNLLPSEYNGEDETRVYNNSEHQINEDAQEGEHPVEYEQVVVDGGIYPDPNNVYLDKDDYTPIEVITPTELTKQIHNEEFIATEKKEEAVEYPLEMLNVQEFTPDADVHLEDGVNVNPIYLASEKNIDPVNEASREQALGVKRMEEPQESSDIDAFDAEQREMLYSEKTGEFVYDQQGDGLNQEYTPTENYPQAQDNAFYESTAGLQEQEYVAEVNEFAETSTRYDQNYEQQYVAPYEQQEYNQGQEQQQYVPPAEGYEQPQQQYQEYEYEQVDHDTVESVQQALDHEEGYAENQDLEPNKV